MRVMSIRPRPGPAYDLPTVMSKLLALGVPLADVRGAAHLAAINEKCTQGWPSSLLLGQLDPSNLDFWSNCWANWHNVGQSSCDFHMVRTPEPLFEVYIETDFAK